MIVIGFIIWGLIWGAATYAVIQNKGYDENWFWWGFFFGFIALIVACAKPAKITSKSTNDDWQPSYMKNAASTAIRNNEWRCRCGRVNPSYTGTCACGRTKDEVLYPTPDSSPIASPKNETVPSNKPQNTEKMNLESEMDKLKLLVEVKKLFDMGVITEEEFQKKKETLL